MNDLNTHDYNEQSALLSLSFLYTLLHNPGVPSKFTDLLRVRLVNINSSDSSSTLSSTGNPEVADLI